jgi:hypothetical protein
MQKTKLMCALALAAVGVAAQAAQALALPDSIGFDGYCDGITGIQMVVKGVFTGTHDYSVCNENGGGYSNTAMMGPAGRRMVGGGGNGVAATDASYPEFNASFLYIVNDDGTWTLWAPEFGGEVNAGTWSTGYPQAAAARAALGARTSFQK